MQGLQALSGGPEGQGRLGPAGPRRGPSPERRMGQQRRLRPQIKDRAPMLMEGRQGCPRRRHAPTGLHWKMAAAQTVTLRSNPVEHGNIRVIESRGQAWNDG
jgi:hypothetical protein